MPSYESRLNNLEELLQQLSGHLIHIKDKLDKSSYMCIKFGQQFKVLESLYHELNDQLSNLRYYQWKDRGILLSELDDSVHHLKQSISKLNLKSKSNKSHIKENDLSSIT
jgi:hypothetical protein